jgi:hypothetical protein
MISSLLGVQAPSRRYSSLGESGTNFALMLLSPSSPVDHNRHGSGAGVAGMMK